MFKTMVVAVDGSEHGATVLETAAELARIHQSRVVLVHALLRGTGPDELHAVAKRLQFSAQVEADLKAMESLPVMAGMAGEAFPVPIVTDDVLQKFGELILEKSLLTFADVVPGVETRLVDDDAADAITACAEEESADLVVTGSRGLGRVKGLILGSVSQKVLHDVPCTCLVVK